MLTPTSTRSALGDLERVPHRVHDPAGDRPGALQVGGGRQQDRELVAAQARDRVAVADAVVQALGELDQQQVADVVAKGVVDLLEAVEIEQQERQGLAARGRRCAAPGRGDR